MSTQALQTPSEFDRHLRLVAKQVLAGKVVPILGAGANLCDRPPDDEWDPEGLDLPSGAELAQWLADELDCDVRDTRDLVEVSQYADVVGGEGALYDKLREVFIRQPEIPSLHRFLARLPTSQLIVSTNYDDLVERALRDQEVEFDLVRYVTNGPHKGKFVHELPDRSEVLIETANAYDAVDPANRTVLLKIHGSVDRKRHREDSYVITEDHYIEYLTRSNPNELIPVKLLEKLAESHLLFLGYGMRDWNLRVMLFQIFEEEDLRFNSWAVQRGVDTLERKLWQLRKVELFEHELSVYVAGLQSHLETVAAERAEKAAARQAKLAARPSRD